MSTRIILFAAAAILIASPAMASPIAPEEPCSELVGAGWGRMPDIADYIKAQRGADKLGYGSECHLGGLVFSQCWLEPRISVKHAIDLLITKARSGKKLPDTPACGA